MSFDLELDDFRGHVVLVGKEFITNKHFLIKKSELYHTSEAFLDQNAAKDEATVRAWVNDHSYAGFNAQGHGPFIFPRETTVEVIESANDVLEAMHLAEPRVRYESLGIQVDRGTCEVLACVESRGTRFVSTHYASLLFPRGIFWVCESAKCAFDKEGPDWRVACMLIGGDSDDKFQHVLHRLGSYGFLPKKRSTRRTRRKG